ncbi:MAG: exodeoxyribonuclease V subunit alpha [Magnetococcales bacterium]|nr:exodeoxyribonuclease V subunit alpha [Magnetococcales bacterium]
MTHHLTFHHSPESLLALLTRWQERGWLRPMDVAFATFLRQEGTEADPRLLLAAALVSHQAGRGLVQLDLAATLADPETTLALPPEGSGGHDPTDPDLPARWLADIELTGWLHALTDPQRVAPAAAAAASTTPLVLDQTRLFLRRFWQCQQEVESALRDRLENAGFSLPPATALRPVLDTLLPTTTPFGADADWQRMACALMTGRRFGIITGGPGTGKTTTVVRLLALLQILTLQQEKQTPARPLRMALAAPTGKAAARLSSSLTRELDRLTMNGRFRDEAILATIPRQVTTLHRLLGAQRESRHFRHHAGNPLWLDLLVIDEASMVGLELLADLLAALPQTARLILLGDKDQLDSVEAGALLGTWCQRALAGHYTPETAAWLHAATGHTLDPALIDPTGTPLDQAVVMLRRNFRFSATSGIGQLAQAVNAGDPQAVTRIWQQKFHDLSLYSLRAQPEIFAELVVAGDAGGASMVVGSLRHDEYATRQGGYRAYLAQMRQHQPPLEASEADLDRWAGAVIRCHGAFQVLCLLRQGPWGVEGLNERIACDLRAAGCIPTGQGWYPGRPVMVTRNNHELGLMNGDIGITLERPVEGKRSLRVAFPGPEGSDAAIRWFPPSRLTEVETVFAMTVHKSQGSEFSRVLLVLPEHRSALLTRELIYTAITRARDGFTLVCAGEITLLEQAVSRKRLTTPVPLPHPPSILHK